MPLNWDNSKCLALAGKTQDSEELAWHEVMVFTCEVIGLDEVTEKNLDEWKFRTTYLYLIHHSLAFGNLPIPFHILKAYVGLKTNATILTRHKFLKKCTALLTSDTNTAVANREKDENIPS